MAQALPQLFQRFNAHDWAQVRAAGKGLQKGALEALATSMGYIDIGRTDGGAVFIGAKSSDASGAGAVEYRKLYQMQWPK